MAVLHKKYKMIDTRQEIYRMTLARQEMLALINMMKNSDVSPETGEYPVSEEEYKIITDLQALMNVSVFGKKISTNLSIKVRCPDCNKTQIIILPRNEFKLIACHYCKHVNYYNEWSSE